MVKCYLKLRPVVLNKDDAYYTCIIEFLKYICTQHLVYSILMKVLLIILKESIFDYVIVLLGYGC